MNLYKTFSDVNCGEGVACLFFCLFFSVPLSLAGDCLSYTLVIVNKETSST